MTSYIQKSIAMKNLFLLPALIITLNSQAQRPQADELLTNNGSLIIQPIYHGSLVLTWNSKTIYVDPYGGSKAYEGLANPDIILITDIHGDHLDTATLNHLQTTNALFITPQAVADLLPESYTKNLVILGNGDNTTQLGMDISALPMYNLPEEADSKHPKGRGNGYLLKFGDKTVYISGDTEDISEMRQLTNIDVAFICMNLPYTMDIDQAASAVLEFKPTIVYPYHYRGKDGLSDISTFQKLVKKGNKSIEVRLRDWYVTY
jgi:L-ascorbate metabolism protein UlaG (beta-lactamase superfamily)